MEVLACREKKITNCHVKKEVESLKNMESMLTSSEIDLNYSYLLCKTLFE